VSVAKARHNTIKALKAIFTDCPGVFGMEKYFKILLIFIILGVPPSLLQF
jgi:hypothetical protein